VLEIKFDKVVIVGGSNNAKVWGRSPQPPKAKGFRRRSPRRKGDFLYLFPKNTHS